MKTTITSTSSESTEKFDIVLEQVRNNLISISILHYQHGALVSSSEALIGNDEALNIADFLVFSANQKAE